MPGIERGRALHREFHGTEPPNLMLTEFAICGTDLEQTENEARAVPGASSSKAISTTTSFLAITSSR